MVGPFRGGRVLAVIGAPDDPRRFYFGAVNGGVWRTDDGGRTWAKTLYKDADTGAIDLAFQPGNPSIVYAALWQTRRPPWNTYPPSSGPGGGLYKSVDGGRTWRRLVGHGLPTQTARIGFA